MRIALTISACAHAAILSWGLISFVVNPLEAEPVEALPVDIITDADLKRITDSTQITAGAKNAPKSETPKPLVEKVGEPKLVEDAAPPVSAKPPIMTASATPVPLPQVRPPMPKRQARAEPDDPIAEALKKDEAKKRKKTKKRERAFEPNRIAALLDKREPRRWASAGDTLSQTASLGVPGGTAQTLTLSEIDALRAQIQACWNPPAGVRDAKELIVKIRLQLRRDGALSADPTLLNRGSHPIFQIAAESAIRAIRSCQPYKLPLAKYEIWQDVEVTFDPRDMYRG